MIPVDSVPVREGEILAGKYRIERVLGAGGMGVVVQAMHLQLEQRVAIKFLLPVAAESPEVVARFAREARAAAKVHGEHIVRVMDVAQLEDGTPYMVMEYLEGRDLAHEIARSKQLPVAEAIGWVLEACEAIADAHAAGIVHRDLKPANLFLSRRRDGGTSVKVLDFGISKTMPGAQQNGHDVSLTNTNAVMGSPLYMSPEQMRSARNTDVRSDIWALGVILYESLAGKVPFEAQQMPELCARVLTEEPQPISSLRPDVPTPVAAVIETCLRKNPADRFQNVAELAAALAPFGPPAASMSAERARGSLEAAGVSVRPSAGPRSAPAQSGAAGISWVTSGAATRRPAVIAGASVGALLLIAIPVALFLRAKGPVAEPGAPLISSVTATADSSPLPATPASASAPPVASSAAAQPTPPKTSPASTATAALKVPPAATPTIAPPTATATSKSNMNLK